MANNTLTDLLLFSAGAVQYIYILKNSDCMSLDTGDSRCHGRSFSMGKKRMTQKASVNGSYNHGLAFASHSICFSKHACTIEILLIKCWYSMSFGTIAMNAT